MRALRPCGVAGCSGLYGKPGSARGWCGKHYQKWKLYGDPEHAERQRGLCVIEGCSAPVEGRGWCSKHYTRWKRYGDPVARMSGEVVDGKRICPGCGVDKPVDDYSAPTGRCRPCVAENMRQRRALNPPPKRERHPAVCDNCGETFMGDKRRWRYCSRECFRAYRSRANWKHGATRRMRLRAAFIESFDRREIFERDDWVCQLCHEPVNRDARWPDQSMPSLDHIVPIARGGTHERANAQTAHLGCNVRKGAALPAA